MLYFYNYFTCQTGEGLCARKANEVWNVSHQKVTNIQDIELDIHQWNAGTTSCLRHTACQRLRKSNLQYK